MSMSDPIADMLTRIRNAQSTNKASVSMPASKLKTEIARILKEEGYITNFKVAAQELVTSRLRILAYPFGSEVEDFIGRHDRVYVIDQNRDAQLLMLMRLELSAERIAKLRSVRYYGGLPLDARTVTDSVAQQEGL